ncbi:MAG TPA: pseudouridine synthase [Selenomonadales bacterium]|nr:pseudouridine synthase [Selenomonadales bacterium]
MQERLQKIISEAGVASRRKAEELITGGRVTVNGKVVSALGTKVVRGRDTIAVDGKPLGIVKKFYILFHKPKGVITSLHDPEGRKTVADYIADIPARLYPVGRLDYATEGLLLLTNDGELTNALLHPSQEIAKTYWAEVAGIPAEEKLDLLRAGIRLDDGPTAPARVRILDRDEDKNRAQLEIIIHEGRNRQVRRMCEAIGHPVNKLKRVKFAFLTLEGVRRGKYRHLEREEVTRLKELAGASKVQT